MARFLDSTYKIIVVYVGQSNYVYLVCVLLLYQRSIVCVLCNTDVDILCVFLDYCAS